MVKKIVSIVISLVVLIALTSCGEVKKTEKQIDALGNITIDSNDAIQSAQNAFDELSDEDKAKVENYSVLEEAHEQYALAVKEKDYNDGLAAFQSGDYATAKSIFDSLKDYKDSKKQSAEAEKAKNYEVGINKYGQGKYLDAANLFVKAKDYSDAKQKLFESGVALLDAGKYSDAVTILNKCDNADSKGYIEYAQGAISIADANYEEAQKHFKAAGNIKDAKDQVSLCVFMQAEENMKKGYLNTAKTLYKSLPANYSHNGANVKSRLDKLDKFNAFVELCGVWKCDDMDSSVRQTHDSTGLWDQWDGDGWGYTVEVTCTLNNDDTATLKAKANFWHYTNFSSISSALRYGDDSCTFTYTGKTVPSKMDYSLDFNNEYRGTLKISGKTFKLDYQIIDRNYSINFTYTYKSFGTYNTLVNKL